MRSYARYYMETFRLQVIPRQRILDTMHVDVANVDPTARKLDEELNKLRREQSSTINPIPESMVMTEMAHPKPAFVLKRGAYDAPTERVEPGTPALFRLTGTSTVGYALLFPVTAPVAQLDRATAF